MNVSHGSAPPATAEGPDLRLLTVEAEAAATANGKADPWHRLSEEERVAIVADARNFRAGLATSLQRLGLDSAEDYFAAVASMRGEHPSLFGDVSPYGDIIGLSLTDFLAQDAGEVRWFGPIVEGSTAAALGRPESFKSFGMVQLGLCGAAGIPWLGIELGEPRPFLYVSAEKSRATVRDRFARMTTGMAPQAPVRIVHRAGVTFGDPRSWGEVRRAVDELGDRAFVVLDTVASLAGPGFDENSGKDMAVVLAAIRQLGDAGATVAACHHPSKFGEGTGGIRLRGHTSLFGEIDGVLEFTRPDRDAPAGMIRVEPKDGDLRLLTFRWDRDTFLLTPDTSQRLLTPTSLAAVVDALYDGTGLTADRIAGEFPGHGRTIVRDRINQAVAGGLIARIGRSTATRYVPTPGNLRADAPMFSPPGRSVDDPDETRTLDLPEDGRSVDAPNPGRASASGGYRTPPRTPDGTDAHLPGSVS